MAKQDQLWAKYWGIRDEHRNGHATAVLWHLALRHDPIAMVKLGSTFDKPGRRAAPYSQEGLAFRAYRSGCTLGAQHLAMNAFNRGDLAGYRHWLARAALRGDQDAERELRRFEVRLPHQAASRVGRKRPYRASDFA